MKHLSTKTLRLIIFILFVISPTLKLSSQNFSSFIDSLVSLVNQDSLMVNLKKFESLGVKSPGSVALTNTANWIESYYKDLGYSIIQRDSFTYNGKKLCNLIIDKEGTETPDKYVYLTSHYDTKNGPGANDNGSGTVILMEAARILKSIPIKTSLRFCHFSAEENGLIGSTHYVNTIAVPQRIDIKIVFNIDEVGGVKTEPNLYITCERDESAPSANNAISAAYTDSLMSLTETYTPLLAKTYMAYGSDYVPFQEAGYTITGLYESNESPFVHTINDKIINMDTNYLLNVAQVVMAGTAEWVKPFVITIGTDQIKDDPFRLWPTVTSDFISINHTHLSEPFKVAIFSSTGALISQQETTGSILIDMSRQAKGMFFVQITTGNGLVIMKRVIVI